ncbi:helix-turn-helix domain-containing protein [Amycolatopsis anabasis]|uniref:helix-turn-helix domain-containing protein n=1 Tax=Amycolatopsis anabasis TaxID=1840409 RepID=UPI00131E0276|nr:helix-turn-helix transcriptional regulator [Amycolatopsis anabasis]
MNHTPAPAKRLWRPVTLPGVEVLHAENIRYSRHDQALSAGYVLKIAVAGTPAGMRYRGRALGPSAVGAVTVLEPDELLQAWGNQTTASYQVLFVEPDLLTSDDDGRRPWFPRVYQQDPGLWHDLRRLHRDLALNEGALAVQSALTRILASLVHRHAGTRPRPRPAPPPPGLRAARDLLHDRLDANITLDELADAAGCGKRQLLRSFGLAYGAPPHAYQTALRLATAKRLLASGRTAAEVAADVGFYDQSQLNRHFRRLWGTSAGTYARSTR